MGRIVKNGEVGVALRQLLGEMDDAMKRVQALADHLRSNRSAERAADLIENVAREEVRVGVDNKERRVSWLMVLAIGSALRF